MQIEKQSNLADHHKLAQSHALLKEFKYKHKNPYHDKLGEFSHFVLRDDETENFQGVWNKEVFKNELPIYVEIGSGYGHFIREYCQNNRNLNFIGIEYRFKRAFSLVQKLDRLGLNNVRYMRAKGERINFMFGEEEIDRLHLFFPDPWRKKKHNKKRIFQKPLLDAAYEILKPGGEFHIKTDHDEYALWMLCLIEQDPRFELVMHTADLHEEFPDHELAQYITKFEKIFIGQGISTKAFVLRKK